MRHKLLFLLFLVMIFSPHVLEAKTDKNYIKKIFELTKQDYDLAIQVTERLNFKVSEKQFLRRGDTLKYILKGSDNKLYLFKTYKDYEDESIINSSFSTKFAGLCGIRTVDCLPLWVPINWGMVYGSLQVIVQDIGDFDSTKPPSDKNWLKYYLFRWLLDDLSPDFYFLPDGSIVNLDLDKIRDNQGMDFRDFDYGKFDSLFRICMKEGRLEDSFKEALSFIDYAESLPQDVIIDLFSPYAFYERVNSLVFRKNKIRSEFTKYCVETARELGVKFSPSIVDGGNKYAKRVLAGLERNIAGKKEVLRVLPKEPVLKNNLELITSQNALSLIDFSKAPIDKLGLLVRQRIETLKELRKETKDTYERLALSLCINRYRQFLPFLNYGVLPLENVQLIFAPQELDLATIEANLKAANLEDKDSHLLPESISKLALDDYYEDYIRDSKDSKPDISEWNYIMNGNCYLYRFELKKALDEFDRVISMPNPDKEALYLAYIISGYVYELNKEYIRFGKGCLLEKAGEQFKQALKVKPGSKIAGLNLGIINWLEKNEGAPSGAINNLDAEGHYVMSLIYTINKQYKLADEHIVKAADLGFNNELFENARAQTKK